jgi:hypothetical protein
MREAGGLCSAACLHVWSAVTFSHVKFTEPDDPVTSTACGVSFACMCSLAAGGRVTLLFCSAASGLHASSA